MQIRTRLTLQFIVVVSLIIFFGFGIIYYSSSVYRKSELYERLENKARTSAEIFISVEQIDSTMLRIFDKTQKDKFPFERVSIFNYTNRQVYTSNDTLALDVNKELLDEVRLSGRKEFTQHGAEVLGITYNDKYNRFVVFASARDVFGKKKLQSLGNTLIVLLLVISSIVAVAGWIYSGRALRPLSRIMDEVHKIDIDKLDTRLHKSKYDDEIGRLISTFNTLLDRIESSFKIQKLFVSGASHELKNPLTSITSQLQVVLLKERNSEEYRQIIQSILEDISNLNKTTFDLIEFARLNYENQIQVTDTRIDDVIWACREYFTKTNPDYKIRIVFPDMPEDETWLIVKGNPALLKIACINLIDNACKFSVDKTCSISLFARKNSVSMSFKDSGIGIPEEQLPYIFEPFYRGNSTAETSGHGLGLALTRKIIQLHKANISVESQPKIGSTFYIRF